MAPIAQASTVSNGYDGSRPRFQSRQAWLDIYGPAEYVAYTRNNAPPHLSYEEWVTSEHILGPYLWQTTLDVWEEDSSSDEESELEASKLASRGLPERVPKRSVTTNGHGMRRAAKASASTPHERSDEQSASAKRRRRPKKKYLSEEIVASEDTDDIEEPTPAVEVASPEAPTPTATANGRRKSGGRRKKQFLSEETISPEDLEDDAMSIDDVAVAARNAVAPAPPEYHTAVTKSHTNPPKKKPGRKPKKKSHLVILPLPDWLRSASDETKSQETVPLDDDEDSIPTGVATPNTASASPEGASGSSASRRGLRVRTPAQQRPYQYDEKLFEEQVLVDQKASGSSKRSPRVKATKLAQVSYPPGNGDDEDDEDDEVLFDEEYDNIVVHPEDQPRKAHYKGKGRAWKKTEEDEDEDYVSPVKAKSSNQPKRKLGRRRSAQASAVNVEDDDSEVEEQPKQEYQEPDIPSPTEKATKQKRRPRKTHHLSEEFVRDDSDTEVEQQVEVEKVPELKREPEPTVVTPVRKKKGRPRKSDQSITSKGTVDIEHEAGYASGSKKSTPKTNPRKARGSIASLTGTSEEKKGDEEDRHDEQSLLSPLREVRKRKSLSVEGGQS